MESEKQRQKRKLEFDDQYSENGIHFSFLNQIYPKDLLETMNSMEKLQLYKLIINISKFYDFENIQNKIL